MQIVGYERSGRGSSLLVSDDGDLSLTPLSRDETIAFGLGDRHCAGAIDYETGEHVPCDRDAAPYCDAHTSTWVCARCTGTCLKDEMDCYTDHAVYLAAFAPTTFKVGVTQLERLETRLREQGADRAAHIHTVTNGRIARELEAEIATDLTDRVRIERKIEGLAADVDDDAWESVLATFDPIERFSFDYGLSLATRPVTELVGTGTVVGLKGRLLVLERRGTTYAVDLRELVGHELDADDATADRQSSLGAFAGD
ncbi:Protein of unknown function (DUF2797) [Halovivax ruber XH-70]|uniref:DUF2797 domain-containing protein n=1 Tax=Halovivax ruber (strain DSM 18193 / JCM 13892 / XH-70) TaxID=797302 RepID=L0I7F3_HALRX|nr:DUF2797 domain-containing protein [Halovivax ruber]AGB15495.1 Protein of unknown function (DUF2797) [Halovivax ruber XH-70]